MPLRQLNGSNSFRQFIGSIFAEKVRRCPELLLAVGQEAGGFLTRRAFGLKEEVLKSAQSKYALETYYDEGSMLAKRLEVYRVPTMLFLEDGIITKTWLDGTPVDEKSQAKFKQWLESL